MINMMRDRRTNIIVKKILQQPSKFPENKKAPMFRGFSVNEGRIKIEFQKTDLFQPRRHPSNYHHHRFR
jgi:hypothetical protein